MATQTDDDTLSTASSLRSSPYDNNAIRNAQDILNLTDLEFSSLIEQ